MLNVFIYNFTHLHLEELLDAGCNALHTLVKAHLAHRLATEKGGEPHVAARADLVFTWAADCALGRVALKHGADVSLTLHVVDAHARYARSVLATSLTVVLANLAHHLGADRAGDDDVRMGVLDVDGRTLRVLVVLDLGGVLDTLVSLDDVLSGRRLHNDAALHVHEGSGLGGGRHV